MWRPVAERSSGTLVKAARKSIDESTFSTALQALKSNVSSELCWFNKNIQYGVTKAGERTGVHPVTPPNKQSPPYTEKNKWRSVLSLTNDRGLISRPP